MTRVKICGITNYEDAAAAVTAGADALGFVFAESPRRTTPDAARSIIARLPPFVQTIGVFVGDGSDIGSVADYCGLGVIQLHSGYTDVLVRQLSGRRLLLGVRVKDESSFRDVPGIEQASAVLLDAFSEVRAGGTGTTFDWELAGGAAGLGKPIIVSGGLTPDNVFEAVRRLRPYGVDVASGVEASPGVKDPVKVRQFIERSKSADNS